METERANDPEMLFADLWLLEPKAATDPNATLALPAKYQEPRQAADMPRGGDLKGLTDGKEQFWAYRLESVRFRVFYSWTAP